MYLVPVDGYPSSVPGSYAEGSLLGLCPGRRPTQSQWGSSHPSRWLPQATDSESINLAVATAALGTFQIGLLRSQTRKPRLWPRLLLCSLKSGRTIDNQQVNISALLVITLNAIAAECEPGCFFDQGANSMVCKIDHTIL